MSNDPEFDPDETANSGSNSESSRFDVIIESVIEKLQHGAPVDYDKINQENSDLQPELGQHLRTLARVFELPDPTQITRQSDESSIFSIGCPHCGVGIKVIEVGGSFTCDNCGSSVEVSGSGPSGDPTLSLTFKEVGRFTLLAVIGRGAFGVVYEGYDTELGRKVAIKLPRHGTFARLEDKQRFLREARHVAQLNHPNIVPIFEIGHYDETPFIVSELIEGRTLADLLRSGGLGWKDSALVIADVADALHYAHEKKIVHRDIKPSNILLDHDNQPHITDFGLATAQEGNEFVITVEGHIVGTPSYMSPEQVRGDKVGPASDIFSLAVVLYQMLVGELPFRGSKRLLMKQIEFDDPESPRSKNDQIPRDLETVLLHAMKKEPSSRYETAEQFASDLRNAALGNPILARPPSLTEQWSNRCRRRPAVTALVASLALLLLAMSVAGFIWGSRERTTKLDQADRLARVINGEVTSLLDQEKNVASLPYIVEAFDPLSNFPERYAMNQRRFGNVLACCPNLVFLQSGKAPVRRLRLSPNDRYVAATFTDGRVMVWDIALEKSVVDEPESTHAIDIAFSPDNRFIAVAKENVIKVCNLASGSTVAISSDHTNHVTDLAFSPDSAALLSSSLDGNVRLWPFQSGGESVKFENGGMVDSQKPFVGDILWISEKEFVSSAYTLLPPSSAAYLWHVDSSDQPVSKLTLKNRLSHLKKHPNQRRLLGRSGSRRVVVLDADNEKLSQAFECREPDYVRLADFRPDGSVIVASDGGNVRLINTDRSEESVDLVVAVTDPTISSVSNSDDGNQIAITDKRNDLSIYELPSGRRISGGLIHGSKISTCCFSRNGRYVVTGGDDGVVKIWDKQAKGSQSIVIQDDAEPGSKVGRFAFSSSKKWLALFNNVDGPKLTLCSCVDRKIRWQLDLAAPCHDIAFSPDSTKVLAACGDGIGRIFSVDSGQLLSDKIKVDDRLGTVAYFPDGKRIAGANLKSHSDMTREPNPLGNYPNQIQVFVWDLETGKRSEPLYHDNLVTFIKVSPDGKYLATVCFDKSIRFWETDKLQPVSDKIDFGANYVQDCMFGSDSKRFFATGGDNNSLVSWNLAPEALPNESVRFLSSTGKLALRPGSREIVVGTFNGRLVPLGDGRNPGSKSIQLVGNSPFCLDFDRRGDLLLTTAGPTRLSGSRVYSRMSTQLWDWNERELIGPLVKQSEPTLASFFEDQSQSIVLVGQKGTVTFQNLVTETRPLDQVRDLAWILSGHRLQAGSGLDLQPIPADELLSIWQRVRNKHPETSPASYDPAR